MPLEVVGSDRVVLEPDLAHPAGLVTASRTLLSGTSRAVFTVAKRDTPAPPDGL